MMLNERLDALVEHPAKQAVASARDAVTYVPEGAIAVTRLSSGGPSNKRKSSRGCEQGFVSHGILKGVGAGIYMRLPTAGTREWKLT